MDITLVLLVLDRPKEEREEIVIKKRGVEIKIKPPTLNNQKKIWQ
jgi:hypothetical protein